MAYGAFIERHWFALREESLAILPPGSAPFTVLHLSDIHLSLGQHKKTEWLKGLAALKPDLVVNTGDNLSHPPAIAPLLDALGPLMEFPGVFVPGSNDYFAPRSRIPCRYFSGPSKLPTGRSAPPGCPGHGTPARGLRSGRLGQSDQPGAVDPAQGHPL